MKRCIYLITFFFFLKLQAQEINPSITYIKTCIEKTQCSSINNSSFLFYDELKAQFYLKVDFNKFKTGQDSIDYWLTDLTESFLYFKAPFAIENFSGLSNHNHKSFKLNGQVFFNGIWHNQSIDLSLFATENGTLSHANSGKLFEQLKVNFSLSIVPKDFKIHKKPHHLRKTIFIGVALGHINQLQQGQQLLLGEAYNH